VVRTNHHQGSKGSDSSGGGGFNPFLGVTVNRTSETTPLPGLHVGRGERRAWGIASKWQRCQGWIIILPVYNSWDGGRGPESVTGKGGRSMRGHREKKRGSVQENTKVSGEMLLKGEKVFPKGRKER